MHRRIILALGGAIVLALVPSAALAAGGTTVTIRIEGSKQTLLLPTAVRTHGGSITRYGAPKNACPANSAQGTLDVAAHGKWAGKWFPSFNEYLVTSILGEKPNGADFWELFVGNKSASVGACDIKAKPGEQILFADETGSDNPSGLTAPHSAVAGHAFKVKVVGYTAAGKAKPLAGAVVTGNGIKPAKTNGKGLATIRASHAGVLVLRTSPKKFVRTEAIVHVAA